MIRKPLQRQLEDLVDSLIDECDLLVGVTRLGVALSGGADSVALLHIMTACAAARGIQLFSLHFDHAIRGMESALDAEFARQISERLNIPFFYERAACQITPSRGLSIEMAAREARHAFFRRAVNELNLDAIATGHHADDAAETLMLRLLRGGGATGLAGIKPQSTLSDSGNPSAKPLRLIRPLLRVRRNLIRAWLSANKIPWREDATNNDTSIPRNRIRLDILPAVARLSGRSASPIDALARSAEILRDEDAFLDSVARNWLAKNGSLMRRQPLPLRRLLSEEHHAIRRRVLHIWLIGINHKAANFATVHRLMNTPDDTFVTIAGGGRLKIAGGILFPPPEPDSRTKAHALGHLVEISVTGETLWEGFKITTRRVMEIDRSRTKIGKFPVSATISAAAVKGRSLCVRSRRCGDRIAPYGLAGSRKVKDIFIDAKLPQWQRDRYPLIFCGDELVWIPGYRIAAAYAVKPGESAIKIVVEELRNEAAQD